MPYLLGILWAVLSHREIIMGVSRNKKHSKIGSNQTLKLIIIIIIINSWPNNVSFIAVLSS